MSNLTSEQQTAYKVIINSMKRAMETVSDVKIDRSLINKNDSAKSLFVDAILGEGLSRNINLDITSSSDNLGKKVEDGINELLFSFNSAKEYLTVLKDSLDNITPSASNISDKARIEEIKGRGDKIKFVKMRLDAGELGNTTRYNDIINKQYKNTIEELTKNKRVLIDSGELSNVIAQSLIKDIDKLYTDIKGHEKVISVSGGTLFTRNTDREMLKTIAKMAKDTKESFIKKIPNYFDKYNNSASGELAKNLLFNFSIAKQQNYVTLGLTVLEKNTNYGKFFEYGTGKATGKQTVNTDGIRTWIEDRIRKGRWDNRDYSKRSINEQAFAIAKSIAKKGLRGSNDTSYKREKPNNAHMIEFLSKKLMSEINANWEKYKEKELISDSENIGKDFDQISSGGRKRWSKKQKTQNIVSKDIKLIDEQIKNLNMIKSATNKLNTNLDKLKGSQRISTGLSSRNFHKVKSKLINELMQAKGLNKNNKLTKLNKQIQSVRQLPHNTTIKNFTKTLANSIKILEEILK